MGIDDGFNFCIGDYGSLTSGNTWTPTQFSINSSTGNIGIGATGQSSKFYVNGTKYANGTTYLNGDTPINGMVGFKNDIWHKSIADGGCRLLFFNGGGTYVCSTGVNATFFMHFFISVLCIFLFQHFLFLYVCFLYLIKFDINIFSFDAHY